VTFGQSDRDISGDILANHEIGRWLRGGNEVFTELETVNQQLEIQRSGILEA
jgi:hypothetical protein